MLIALWYLLVVFLDRRGVLERHGLQAWGPVVLLKTRRGRGLLDRLAASKRFWKVYASLGVPAVLLSMAGMLALVSISLFAILQQPPEPSRMTEPRNVLLIPGVNEFVPLVWGIVGLAVTLLVHEFSHAVMARAEDIDVESMGLIFLLVPLGGFAEPNEEQLESAPPWSKIRVFSAGIVSNLVVAILAFGLLMGAVGSAQPVADGVTVHAVVSDGPAKRAGLETGMVITSINGSETGDVEGFLSAINSTSPNQSVVVGVARSKEGVVEHLELPVEMGERDGEAFLGVRVGPGHLELLGRLPSIARDNLPGFLVLISGFPLLVFESVPPAVASAYTFDNFVMASVGLHVINALIWVWWIDFWVGVFNAMPATVLDGGHIFEELFDMLLVKLGFPEEAATRLSYGLTVSFGVLLLSLVVLTVLLPRL